MNITKANNKTPSKHILYSVSKNVSNNFLVRIFKQVYNLHIYFPTRMIKGIPVCLCVCVCSVCVF